MSAKRLTKSTMDKKISGVLAGIANYFEVDSNLIRLGFVILCLATAIVPCIIAYLIADWMIPKDTEL
ncbi:PspC domain-containing protein [Heyndrickxia vini]|uniref:PspC domain-containing protein n=1 Tax=Heyndrickxia vini TaxID=1476025 RepID=A0ABX7E2N0_9BACI|nr:PspC domain-containing protein [Heyndrickxia vini]QQZ09983.1 PspC domain-containing protein [Heyndrickxia vini]